MATTVTRRPRTAIGIPPIREVHAPKWFNELPRWASTGGVLAALVVVSAVLRSRQLGGELWFSEADAIGIAHHSLGQLPGVLRNGGAAPLYYVLLHFWIDVLGSSATDAHALSLLFGLIAIPVAMWVGWSIGGRRAAFFAAVLFAFSEYMTQYAEEAKPYELLALLSLLATAGLIQGFVYRRRAYLWLFAIALEAMLYTQSTAGLYVFGAGIAVAVICLMGDDRAGILRDAAICLGAVAIFYLPWLPTTLHQLAHDTSPWHYAPLIGATLPSQITGGDRVDVTLLVALLVGVVPLAASSRRRSPEAIMFAALLVLPITGIVLARLVTLGSIPWAYRFFGEMVGPILLLAALGAARARIVGVAAVLLCIAFLADPGSFAPAHKSDMREIAAQMAPLLHRGDVVAVAQPEQTPLAEYYLPSGLIWVSAIGPVSDPGYMNWSDAQKRLQNARPATVLKSLVASLKPRQQLLFVRPLTEGVMNWEAPWPRLVRRRAAQWGQILDGDVANGTITQVAVAPTNYPGACCVASSAVLYRKAR